MTRNQMINYILDNQYVPITHILFSEDEFIYAARDGKVYDENGYLFEDWYSDGIARHDGIRERSGGSWEMGWFRKSCNKIFV